LIYQSASVKDNIPLIPDHFLLGKAGGKFALEALDKVGLDPNKPWRWIQALVRHF